MQQATHAVDDALATTMHATRCAVSRALGTSPCAMVFQRNMFLNLPVIADLVAIRYCCQEIINENVRCQNLNRQEWDYVVGQEVLIKEADHSKLQPQAHSPYTIVQVFTNGNVAVRDRQNVRGWNPLVGNSIRGERSRRHPQSS
eukprot:14367752-Ditylum_brightwellii.AAC.1